MSVYFFNLGQEGTPGKPAPKPRARVQARLTGMGSGRPLSDVSETSFTRF